MPDRRTVGRVGHSDKRGRNATKIERLMLSGPEGRLEALFEWEPASSPKLATVICHPHPLYGGAMHNKVVYRAAKAALAAGVPAIRFNFRGVGRSEGHHANGIGERDDARAALNYVAGRFPGLPIVMMGFSFGSGVGLFVGAEDPRVSILVGLGLPVVSTDFHFLESSRKSKLIVQAGEDQYGPREKLMELYMRLQEPKQLHLVEGVDHFFTGKLPEVQSAIESFLRQQLMAMK